MQATITISKAMEEKLRAQTKLPNIQPQRQEPSHLYVLNTNDVGHTMCRISAVYSDTGHLPCIDCFS